MKSRKSSVSKMVEGASRAATTAKESFLTAAATASTKAKSFAKWANDNISAFRTRFADYQTQFEKASPEKAEQVLEQATEDATKVIIAASAQAGQVLNAEEQNQVRASIRMSRGSKGFNPKVLEQIVEDTVKRMSLVREDDDEYNKIFGPDAKPFASVPTSTVKEQAVSTKPPIPRRPDPSLVKKAGTAQSPASTVKQEDKRMSTRPTSAKLEEAGVHQPSVSEYSAEALKWARITQRDPKDYRANPLAGSTPVTLQKTTSTASVVSPSATSKPASKSAGIFEEMQRTKLKSAGSQAQVEKPKKALSALEEAIAKRKQVVSAQMKNKGGA